MLSLTACLGWTLWSSDISTAFLQGCHSQLDAPRRWYLEAKRRLTSLKLKPHMLDPSTFLIFEDAFHEIPRQGLGRGESGLVGMICLHGDDMLGAGLEDSLAYQHVITEPKKTFSFRECKNGDELEYCGAELKSSEDGILRLHHGFYLKRVKPMTLPKHVGPEKELSGSGVSALRGLVGSLSWPAVQSSPHLQASTSMLSGDVS